MNINIRSDASGLKKKKEKKDDDYRKEENLMKNMFRFPRILAVNNRTDPKSEMSVRFTIKFATKAVKTPYPYTNSIKL